MKVITVPHNDTMMSLTLMTMMMTGTGQWGVGTDGHRHLVNTNMTCVQCRSGTDDPFNISKKINKVSCHDDDCCCDEEGRLSGLGEKGWKVDDKVCLI